MSRTLLAAAAATAIALLTAAAAVGQTHVTTLKGTVGPGYTIKLTTAGHAVKTLNAGTYTVTVSDRSPIHNFVLERQGGSGKAITTPGFSGTKTVHMKLSKGRWKFYCAPHESLMFGFFTVK
jgi:plastocyanin